MSITSYNLCSNHKRILVVDWSDKTWTHEKKINSDFYFRFKNLYSSIRDFHEFFLSIVMNYVPRNMERLFIDQIMINLSIKKFFMFQGLLKRITLSGKFQIGIS